MRSVFEIVASGMWLSAALALAIVQTSCASNSNADSAPIVFEVLPGDEVKIEVRVGGIRMTDLSSDRRIVFAMNGGIFERPEASTGLLVSGGVEVRPINVSDGDGNFFMKPNGVLFRTDDGKWQILESSEFQAQLAGRRVADATQSGPMILRKGVTHPLIRKKSENRLLRNAACVDPEGSLHLFMSREDATFHEMVQVARQRACTDALYLDGVISSVLRDGKIHPPGNQARRYASVISVRRQR